MFQPTRGAVCNPTKFCTKWKLLEIVDTLEALYKMAENLDKEMLLLIPKATQALNAINIYITKHNKYSFQIAFLTDSVVFFWNMDVLWKTFQIVTRIPPKYLRHILNIG